MNKEKEEEEMGVIRMICNLTKDFRTESKRRSRTNMKSEPDIIDIVLHRTRDIRVFRLLEDELLKTIDVKSDLLRGVTGFDKGRIPLQGSSR